MDIAVIAAKKSTAPGSLERAHATYALRNDSKETDIDKEAHGRFKIREICEGRGSYRDAAE